MALYIKRTEGEMVTSEQEGIYRCSVDACLSGCSQVRIRDFITRSCATCPPIGQFIPFGGVLVDFSVALIV